MTHMYAGVWKTPLKSTPLPRVEVCQNQNPGGAGRDTDRRGVFVGSPPAFKRLRIFVIKAIRRAYRGRAVPFSGYPSESQ